MKKTSASIFLALFLDFLFSLLFILFLIFFQHNNEELTYYMNQVGIFKEEENANNKIDEIKEIGLMAFSYKNDDLLIVVTSITLDKETCLKEQETLKVNNISSIQKQITTSNQKITNALKNEQYEIIMKEMSK